MLINDATNPNTRTMGITPSRTFLLQPPAPRKSEVYPNSDIRFVSETHRLVRDELRKETQRSIFNQKPKARHSLSFLQVAPEGLQQKDVRPVLPLEANQVPRH